jgi:hypothetical protein
MKKLIFLFTFLIVGTAISSGIIACSKKGSGSSNPNPYYNGYAYPGSVPPGYPGYGYPGSYPGYYQPMYQGSCDLRLPGMSCPPGFQCVPMFGPYGACQRMF